MNPLMNTHFLAIGTLGNMEIFIIAILVLVLFGAKKLPTFARSLGRSMGEFKKAREEFENELHRASDEVVSTPPASIKAPTTSSSTTSPSPAPAAVERERDHHEA